MTEYEKQADDLLAKFGVKFSAQLIGSDCPKFCEDARKGTEMDRVNVFPRKTHIHGKHYRCEFFRPGKPTLYVDFWNSYRDEEHNAKPGIRRLLPTPYDVLTCITKQDPGSFENFCGEYGYDEDSRKAEDVYRACCEEWRRVQMFFTPVETEALELIQ